VFKTQIRPAQTTAFANRSALTPTVNDDLSSGFKEGDRWLQTTATRRVFECFDHTNGAAVWQQVINESFVNQAVARNQVMFGSLLDYPNSGGTAAGEIQYVRVSLVGGTIFSGMQTFLDGGGNPSRNIRFALYDQADPDDDSLGPSTRLTQTAQIPTTGNGFIGANFIGGNYTIVATGFYWLAVVQDSPVISYAVTDSVRANFLPVAREDPGSTADLPATAGITTNPVSALIFVALVEA
jgi:hypothetical protein